MQQLLGLILCSLPLPLQGPDHEGQGEEALGRNGGLVALLATTFQDLERSRLSLGAHAAPLVSSSECAQLGALPLLAIINVRGACPLTVAARAGTLGAPQPLNALAQCVACTQLLGKGSLGTLIHDCQATLQCTTGPLRRVPVLEREPLLGPLKLGLHLRIFESLRVRLIHTLTQPVCLAFLSLGQLAVVLLALDRLEPLRLHLVVKQQRAHLCQLVTPRLSLLHGECLECELVLCLLDCLRAGCPCRLKQGRNLPLQVSLRGVLGGDGSGGGDTRHLTSSRGENQGGGFTVGLDYRLPLGDFCACLLIACPSLLPFLDLARQRCRHRRALLARGRHLLEQLPRSSSKLSLAISAQASYQVINGQLPTLSACGGGPRIEVVLGLWVGLTDQMLLPLLLPCLPLLPRRSA
mmetsp:Transcript_5357/g.11732  ORF Transcript_5357/g.11732 Transcript_5357/m.11732 type:complete len:409 (+) Transcript_5357:1897-3123(+)